MPRRFICLMVFVLGCATGVLANPQDYPEFAQQKIKDDIQIQFVAAETVKQHLDEHATQVIIDVRSRSSYAKRHLPGARKRRAADKFQFLEHVVKLHDDNLFEAQWPVDRHAGRFGSLSENDPKGVRLDGGALPTG